MPNWCSTTYCVYGKKNMVNDCRDFIKKALENPINKEADNPKNWLGNIVLAAGGDNEKIRCRGWVNDIEPVSDLIKDKISYFYIYSEDAWSPCEEAVEYVVDYINNLYKVWGKEKLELCLLGIEPGCELYINTDTTGLFFTQKYYLQIEDEGGEWYEYEIEKEEEIPGIVNCDLHTEFSKGTGIEEIVDEINDMEKHMIWVHEFVS